MPRLSIAGSDVAKPSSACSKRSYSGSWNLWLTNGRIHRPDLVPVSVVFGRQRKHKETSLGRRTVNSFLSERLGLMLFSGLRKALFAIFGTLSDQSPVKRTHIFSANAALLRATIIRVSYKAGFRREICQCRRDTGR